MALQKTDGTYITVEDVKEDIVIVRFYKDSDHRERYKNSTESEFETTVLGHENINPNLVSNADASKSIKDNNITAGYVALKALDKYSDCSNV